MPQLAAKEKRLSVRATEPEKELLAQAAKARRINVSQFMLKASLDAAAAVLGEQTEYRLSADQWEAFCRRMDEPAKELLSLRQLFRENGPF